MDTAALVKHWRFRSHRVQLAHYEAARSCTGLHLWLGLPAIMLSTVVGTSVFASMQRTTEPWIQITVGLLSVAAAVFASLQTFLRYAETAEKHRVAGARFASLKHQIELLATMPPANDKQVREALAEVETKWAKLREESPSLPGRLWRRIEREVTLDEQERRYPNFGSKLSQQLDTRIEE